MPSAPKPPKSTLKPAARLRSWRVSLLRQRAHYLGSVEARDEEAAEAAAVKEFGLDDEQRKRLAVRARGRIGCIGRRLRRSSPRSSVSAASATPASRSQPNCVSRQQPSAAFCGAWGSIGWQRWSLPSRCAVTSVNILAS